MVVVGTGGMGKSSWLNLVSNRVEDAKVVRISVDNRVITEQQVVALLADGIGVQVDEQATVSQLIDAINAAGRCIILVDDAHHLVLRGVDVFDGWEAFVRVVDATRDQCMWVVTMCGWTHQFLCWARGGVEPFRTVVKLGSWSEEKVGRLIVNRVERCGYEMDYEDLVVDKLEGVEGEAQLVNTREGYMRLIWDYADGCPVVALHCWRGSLVYDGDGSEKDGAKVGGGGKRVRVRLFRHPNVNELESLNDTQRFVLASIIWHGSLTPEHASKSLNIPLQRCGFAFDKLQEAGIIEREQGCGRVAAGWRGPVTRFLFRKHLIDA